MLNSTSLKYGNYEGIYFVRNYAARRVNRPQMKINSIAPNTAKIMLGILKAPTEAAAAPELPSNA